MRCTFKILLLLCIGISLTACDSHIRKIKFVTIRIIDSNALPISGIKISSDSKHIGGIVPTKKSNITNGHGVAKIFGSTTYPVGGTFRKEGFYPGRWREEDRSISKIYREIVMREKRNPSPMYAIDGSFRLPIKRGKFGFDFENADWVKPHGSGKFADFFVDVKRIFKQGELVSFGYEITFPNAGDGIHFLDDASLHKSSFFPFPYLAPEVGYHDHYKDFNYRRVPYNKFRPRNPNQKKLDHTTQIIRTRTKTIDGEIIRANYTLLDRTFNVAGGNRENPRLYFKYFFNPEPNNRSLEFDPENNLAKKFERQERRSGRRISVLQRGASVLY